MAAAVAAVSVATGNIGAGVLAGLGLYGLLRLLGRGATPKLPALNPTVET